MVEENSTPEPVETPVEETLFERAQRKLAETESALYAKPENKNSLDGAILREL